MHSPSYAASPDELEAWESLEGWMENWSSIIHQRTDAPPDPWSTINLRYGRILKTIRTRPGDPLRRKRAIWVTSHRTMMAPPALLWLFAIGLYKASRESNDSGNGYPLPSRRLTWLAEHGSTAQCLAILTALAGLTGAAIAALTSKSWPLIFAAICLSGVGVATHLAIRHRIASTKKTLKPRWFRDSIDF